MERGLFAFACVVIVSGCTNDGTLVDAPMPGCSEESGATAAIPAPVVRQPRRGEHPTATSVAQPATFAAAATAADLVRAMGREPDGSMSPTLLGSPLAAAVFPGLGELDPTEGGSFVWLSTGVAGAGTDDAIGQAPDGTQDGTSFGLSGCAGEDTYDCVRLTYSFLAPPDAHSVRFDFNFLSTEYPEYIQQGYNDTFSVALESPSFSFDNVSFDGDGHPIGIDSAFFDDGCNQIEGTGFDIHDLSSCDAGATGLLGTIAPIAPGETVTLTFTLNDAGDGIYDSAVMIDNLQTTASEVEDPTTSDCS